jgi:hypothetical protein
VVVFDSESYICDSIILLSGLKCKVVVRCPGLVFVTQEAATAKRRKAERVIYDLRGDEHEDVNHHGEPGQSENPRQLAQQRLHRQSLRGPHPRSPSPRDGRRRGQRLSATATAYSVTKCGDTLLDRGDPECHRKMMARWLATECTQVRDGLWS